MKPGWRTTALRVAILLFVIVLTVVLLLYRDRVKELGILGYPGIFLMSMLSNATLFMPLPGWLLPVTFGAVFSPFWVGLASASGAAMGEMSGYLAGFSGRGVIEKSKRHDTLVHFMTKYGWLTVFVLGFIPNPLFDAAGILAGALKMKWWKFLFWCWLGKICKMLLFAYGGSTILSWFPRF